MIVKTHEFMKTNESEHTDTTRADNGNPAKMIEFTDLTCPK